jgi:hypothetical protein
VLCFALWFPDKCHRDRSAFYGRLFVPKIPGGFYLKARKIYDSEVAHAPPHVREIFDYLISQANHKDVMYFGQLIKRGQCVRTYKDIQEALHWKVGWRKMRYSKWDCEKAMKVLKKATMVTTKKTTRGILITVVNYDTYQTAENYEDHTEDHRKATRKPQTSHTINKNEKNEKEINIDLFPYLKDSSFKTDWDEYLRSRKKKATFRAQELSLSELHKYPLPTAILMIQRSIQNGWQGIFPLAQTQKEAQNAYS